MASRLPAEPVEAGLSPGRRKRPRLTTQVAVLFPYEGEWTEADYLSLPETNRIVELSEGRLVIPDMPSFSHQYTKGELLAALRAFVRAGKLGTVAMAPLRIRLWAGKFREPDVVFLSRARHSPGFPPGERRGEWYWGVPDLVIEVISPRPDDSSSTEVLDRTDKFAEYAHGGIAEVLAGVAARALDRALCAS